MNVMKSVVVNVISAEERNQDVEQPIIVSGGHQRKSHDIGEKQDDTDKAKINEDIIVYVAFSVRAT
jgi:hypothetical protein